MFVRKKLAKRFNLLLLEDEEDYVADWVASCKWPSSVEGNWQGLPSLLGRLRLCTKSLFFDPDDVRVPIVRLEFASVVQLEADGPHSFIIVVSKVTKMKPNMADVPYTVEKNKSSNWFFTLSYVKVDSFMPVAQEQLVISRLPAQDRLELLDAAVKGREDAASFDSSRLVEFSERLLWEGPVLQLSPLVREPGRLAVTDQRIYFQPLHNIAGDTPVRSHPLAAIAAVVRRRSSLRPVGLELFMINPGIEPHLQQHMQHCGPFWDTPSAFFTFRSEAARDKALSCIIAQPQLGVAVQQLMPNTTNIPKSPPNHPSAGQPPAQLTQPSAQPQAAGELLEAAGGWLQRVMMAWQLGKVSNFDYLLYLNLAAGRSFNDLAQWPVFPWVLRDYSSAELDLGDEVVFRDLSKPMGALTPTRLEVFRQRFHDMESLMQHVDAAGDMPKPFMYGTHYSTPGYVMFWLVRAAPGHMLRLQAGRFDAPDRLFNNLQESWDSATTSTTDVKELIPEFYMPGGDFLVNGSQLAFGIRQNGRPVNDVELPPWASSPAELLAKHRAALESPHVSRHLHQWIDLIFGHKQTGAAAVDADNVFYHLTYEGAVDITQVKGLQELKALETQINEFGQTPKQLFTHPHPPRLVQPPTPDPATVFSQSQHTSNGSSNIAATSTQHAVESSTSATAQLTSSKAERLKGGGEDAVGGAICFALLSTILAAASPDIQPTEMWRGLALGAAGSDSAKSEGDRLEPVSDQDAESAVPNKSSSDTVAHVLQQERLASLAVVHGNQRQQLEQPQVSGLRGMLTRLTDTAASAAGSAAASVASAVRGTSSTTTAQTASSMMGLAGMPMKSSASGMKLSLSWMQQQFADGLSLGSSKDKTPSGRASPAPAPQMQSQQAATAGQQAAGQHVSTPGVADISKVPADHSVTAVHSNTVGQQQQQQQQQWPRNLPDRLLVKKSLRLQSGPLTAAVSAGGMVFCVGHAGLLRVLQAPQLTTVRSAKLEQDLLCIGLLPAAGASQHRGPVLSGHSSSRSPGAAGVTGSTGAVSDSDAGGGDVQLQLLLAGSQSGSVLAYSAAAGRLLGSWDAHGDSVSCLLQLGPGGTGKTVTGSYDCSVKVWDVAEGRQPWSSTLPLASAQLVDFDSGVWAMSGSGSGQLLVTGTDDGLVSAWDLRTQQQIWATQISSDYVGGVSLLPGGNYVAAAAADGSISLLEWRRAGLKIASASCGAPLRCCTCDGHLMISGTEHGQLVMWNLTQLLGQQPSDQSFSLAGPDGVYPPVSCPTRAAVNGVCVGAMDTAVRGEQPACNVLAALDDGTLVLFSNE